ncbi:MAG: hypothetical protein OEV40_17875 [Acidimicrobiia bacterium]|nr:hypothetical protein [Acidimicrobiia bacterium]
MATTAQPRSVKHNHERPTPTQRGDEFTTVSSDHGLGYNLPQKMGRAFWQPMLAMALTFWAIGFVLAIIEAGTGRDDLATIQDLSNLVPAFMFVGFLSVFAAISFAVARILGAFRKGGGDVQETVGAEVQTLKMPLTAKAMLALMMMGMMVMAVGIALNLVAAGEYGGITEADIVDNARLAAVAEGLRRLGVALYLTGIAFGLGTIITVLRFQAVRIRELAASHGRNN